MMKPPAGPMGDQMQRRNKTRISNIRNEVNEYVSLFILLRNAIDILTCCLYRMPVALAYNNRIHLNVKIDQHKCFNLEV